MSHERVNGKNRWTSSLALAATLLTAAGCSDSPKQAGDLPVIACDANPDNGIFYPVVMGSALEGIVTGRDAALGACFSYHG